MTDELVTSTCNPGGPCLAFLDAKRLGFVDRKWMDHLAAHGREAEAEERRQATVAVPVAVQTRSPGSEPERG